MCEPKATAGYRYYAVIASIKELVTNSILLNNYRHVVCCLSDVISPLKSTAGSFHVKVTNRTKMHTGGEGTFLNSVCM